MSLSNRVATPTQSNRQKVIYSEAPADKINCREASRWKRTEMRRNPAHEVLLIDKIRLHCNINCSVSFFVLFCFLICFFVCFFFLQVTHAPKESVGARRTALLDFPVRYRWFLVKIDNCTLWTQKTRRSPAEAHWLKLEKVDHVKLVGNPMMWRLSWNLLSYMDNEYSTNKKTHPIQQHTASLLWDLN